MLRQSIVSEKSLFTYTSKCVIDVNVLPLQALKLKHRSFIKLGFQLHLTNEYITRTVMEM